MRGRLTTLTMALGLVVFVAQIASAEVLFEQTGFDPWGAGFFNSESGSPPFGITQHAVNDVTVDGTGWNIDTITTFYSALDQAWGYGITEGYVHVFAKTGALPIDGVDDPTASPLVPMSGVLNVDHWVVTATGLNLNLAPGDYWIMTTPIAPGGIMGPEIHLASDTLIGDATASYDPFAFPGPPAWYNLSPGVDAAMVIEGTGSSSTAVEAGTWGQVKSLYQD